jgi:hypothetical protein
MTTVSDTAAFFFREIATPTSFSGYGGRGSRTSDLPSGVTISVAIAPYSMTIV